MMGWLKSYGRFLLFAKKEFKRSWEYKPMKLLWQVLRGVFSLIGLLVILKYGFHLASKRAWTIVSLSAVIILLLYVVELLRRFHERKIGEISADHTSRITNVKRLSEVYGSGVQLQREMSKEERYELLATLDRQVSTKVLEEHLERVSAARLRHWAAQVEDALSYCYGLSGKTKFEDNWGYRLTVPEVKQYEWLDSTLYRLEDVIKEEMPPLEKVDTSNLPDEVFMA